VSFRRRGAAQALLGEAERQAARHGLSAVALDTRLGNQPARALYAREGFEEVAQRPASRALPGFVALVKRLR
jgi:ribosomal protein S18 acetylase RimI-like enzyme